MAIIDETKQEQSVTNGWRTLQFFTNREEAIRHFVAYLHDEPPRERILFFHGDGGNGKSLLLRYLSENCCKRLQPETWAYLKGMRDGEAFVGYLNNVVGSALPCASLNFGMPPRGEERPQEAFYALLMLRRGLSGHGLRFPLYDFATVWYLHKTNQLNDQRLRTLFPAEEMDLITAIVGGITETPWAALPKALLSIFGKHLKESFTLYMQRRQLDPEEVAKIQRMEPQSELMDELPRLFAQDLNVAMALDEAPSRLVLFFDTHEAFWGAQHHLAHDLYFQRDEWLRGLLASLEYANGIVAVVAGRELPRWGKASRLTIPDKYVDSWLVGHFSEQNAGHYLKQTGVADASLRQRLLDYTQVAPNQHHPLYLGLAVDGVQAAFRQGVIPTAAEFAPHMANKQQQLVDRLLRYVDRDVSYAVRTLSASRAFDRQIYFTLGQALYFQATQPAFEILTQFSFVWRDERRGQGWYRIHDLLRRLLRERDESVVRQADDVLERYYRQRTEAGEEMAIAEAIYHANQLEWELGAEEWVDVFDDAIRMSRYNLCHTLLEVRNELFIENHFWRGQVCRAEGDYFAKLSRYDEARQEYEEAIAAFDQAQQQTPDNLTIYKDKGRALESLGLLHANFAHYQSASDNYQQAIASYDQAIQRQTDYVVAYNNKAITLYELGNLQTTLIEHQQALDSYQQAIAAYDQLFQIDPDYIKAYNNKGLALNALGALQATLAQNQDARHSYQQAIATYDEALHRIPDYAYAYNNKGIALSRLGHLQIALGQHEEALNSYNKAIGALDEALRYAPDFIMAQNIKGNAFRGLGKLQATLSQHQSALISYQQSLAAHDEALQRAPNYVHAHNEKGITLRSLGDLYLTLAQHTPALDRYTQAIAAHDDALHRAPNHVSAHNNKGHTLQRLANLQLALAQQEQALQSLEGALAAFTRSLQIVPGNERIRLAKDEVQKMIEQLRGEINRLGPSRPSSAPSVL
ncbi:MAG: tetratricopeptide repeat protein [Ardenticatenaceae bacterium]